MITLDQALEMVIGKFWVAGQEQFVAAMIAFLKLPQATQLQTIKGQLQIIVDEKQAAADVMVTNAQAAQATLQAEIDEIQAFVDA